MYEVLGFYKFIKINYLKRKKEFLQKFLIKNKIRGTIIISKEGINGTISGKSKDIKILKNKLKKFLYLKILIVIIIQKAHYNHFIGQKLKLKMK